MEGGGGWWRVVEGGGGWWRVVEGGGGYGWSDVVVGTQRGGGDAV